MNRAEIGEAFINSGAKVQNLGQNSMFMTALGAALGAGVGQGQGRYTNIWGWILAGTISSSYLSPFAACYGLQTSSDSQTGSKGSGSRVAVTESDSLIGSKGTGSRVAVTGSDNGLQMMSGNGLCWTVGVGGQ